MRGRKSRLTLSIKKDERDSQNQRRNKQLHLVNPERRAKGLTRHGIVDALLYFRRIENARNRDYLAEFSEHAARQVSAVEKARERRGV